MNRATNWEPGDKVRLTYGITNPLTLKSLPAGTECELLNLERTQDGTEVWLVAVGHTLWEVGHHLMSKVPEPRRSTTGEIAVIAARQKCISVVAALFFLLSAAFIIGIASRISGL